MLHVDFILSLLAYSGYIPQGESALGSVLHFIKNSGESAPEKFFQKIKPKKNPAPLYGRKELLPVEKAHSNLFYIFQLDYAEYPIPPNFLIQLREKLFGAAFAEKHPP